MRIRLDALGRPVPPAVPTLPEPSALPVPPALSALPELPTLPMLPTLPTLPAEPREPHELREPRAPRTPRTPRTRARARVSGPHPPSPPPSPPFRSPSHPSSPVVQPPPPPPSLATATSSMATPSQPPRRAQSLLQMNKVVHSVSAGRGVSIVRPVPTTAPPGHPPVAIPALSFRPIIPAAAPASAASSSSSPAPASVSSSASASASATVSAPASASAAASSASACASASTVSPLSSSSSSSFTSTSAPLAPVVVPSTAPASASARGRPPVSPASLATPTPRAGVLVPSPPTRPGTPQASSATTGAAAVDDERASDSGSSAATEAYNSEDEHGVRDTDRAGAATADVPMRTLRDRERTFARQLASNGLRIVDMRADGNCLFRALAHSVWADAERHAALRARVIEYLVQERDYFSQFVAEDFARYVRRKRRDGTHGNHLELQAAAEVFGRPIEVYSYSATPATIIDSWGTPADPAAAPPEPVRLSFHRGSHYNAVESVATAPEKHAQKRAAAAGAAAVAAASSAADDADWRAIVDARETEEEIERAVLALSLAESREHAMPASAGASSSSTLPSSVRVLIDSGYPEEQAQQAYRVAGHGGLSQMIRFLTADYMQPKIMGRLGSQGVYASNSTDRAAEYLPGGCSIERSSTEGQPTNLERRPEPSSYRMTREIGSSSADGNSDNHGEQKVE